jgi:two-component system osmolarity sensor histidine kinase EnvZ
MSSDIERIDAIVGKFVEYARSGSGDRGPAALIEVDVAAAIDGLRSSWLPRIEAGEMELEVSVPAGLRWRGDPLDFARIVSNLVENAARHGRTGEAAAQVSIAAAREAQTLRLEVADRGPGVPPDQLERLLRPFARIGDERSDRGGSGLGLAIVQRLAHRHGGRCILRNRDGGGLLASVLLPDSR